MRTLSLEPVARQARRFDGEGTRQLHEDDLLSVAAAARIAGRSVRTIRRAYRSGTLIAYRDGNGRGVRIRYGDLRHWMMETSAARRQRAADAIHALEYLDMRGKVTPPPSGDYLALLNAARARQRDGGRDGAGGRRVGDSASPRA